MQLVELVRQETGADFTEMALLRHFNTIDRLLELGGSIEEFTFLQPKDTKWDFWREGKPQIHVIVVIVHDRVFGVFRVRGVEAEGTFDSLASRAHRQFDLERELYNPDRPTRRYMMAPLSCTAINATITGWEGREINAIVRSNAQLFQDIQINLPTSLPRPKEIVSTIRPDEEPLTQEIIKAYVESWKDEQVDLDNPALDATISGVTAKSVRIAIHSGEHFISFKQIIDADKVIRYWHRNGRKPVSKDFSDPSPAIKVDPIHEYSYAPPLAKRVRRQIEAASVTLPEEISEDNPYREGKVHQIFVNRYERDLRAREACIKHYGVTCVVCKFNFGAVYGSLAEGFVHIHHLKPLSEIGEEYEVDPVNDLRPVCPNCHAVIHLRGACRTIETVRLLLAQSADRM